MAVSYATSPVACENVGAKAFAASVAPAVLNNFPGFLPSPAKVSLLPVT